MNRRIWCLVLVLGGLCGCAHQEVAMRSFNPVVLPKPNGYSHVVEVTGGRTLYVSGQLPLTAEGKVIDHANMEAQTQQVFENIKAALAAAGGSMDDVVKITVFMTDLTDLQAFRTVRDRYFVRHSPASSLVQISALVRPECLIEIEALAVVGR